MSSIKGMDQMFYVVHEKDNVATALSDIKPGMAHLRGGIEGNIQVRIHIPFGHKVALRDISKGSGIIKYQVQVAVASDDIKCGDYVHIHNAKSMQDFRSNTFESATANPQDREYTLAY
jgi:altronate dehydratase